MMNSTNKANAYQFNIWSRMIMLSADQRETVFTRIEMMTGLGRGAVKRLVYLKKGGPLRFDYKLLKAFAAIFNVTVEELENHPVMFNKPNL